MQGLVETSSVGGVDLVPINPEILSPEPLPNLASSEW